MKKDKRKKVSASEFWKAFQIRSNYFCVKEMAKSNLQFLTKKMQKKTMEV